MRDTLQFGRAAEGWHKRLSSVAFQFILLFVFWLVLSGHYSAKYIIIGAFSAALITFLTNDLFYAALMHGERARPRLRSVLLQTIRFIAYLPWLFSRIIMANVQVASLVLNPKMPIEPVLLVFRTSMKKGISQVTLANSITLTPGTVTVSLEDGKYIIHTLQPPLAQELVDAVMQNQVAKIFMEEKESPPATSWLYSLEGLK